MSTTIGGLGAGKVLAGYGSAPESTALQLRVGDLHGKRVSWQPGMAQTGISPKVESIPDIVKKTLAERSISRGKETQMVTPALQAFDARRGEYRGSDAAEAIQRK